MFFSRLLSCTCCSRSCLSRGQLGCSSKESLGQLSLLGVKGLGCPRPGLSRERSCQPRIFMKTQKSQGVFVVCFFSRWGSPKVVAEMNVPMIWRVPSWCLPKQDTSAWRPTTPGAVGSKELFFISSCLLCIQLQVVINERIFALCVCMLRKQCCCKCGRKWRYDDHVMQCAASRSPWVDFLLSTVMYLCICSFFQNMKPCTCKCLT